MREKNKSATNYINIDSLIEDLSKYKNKHIHFDDAWYYLFNSLNHSFGIYYHEREKSVYAPEPTDIILFYALCYHGLENNSRFMYNKKWIKDLSAWHISMINKNYKIEKRIKFSTLEKRMKKIKKLWAEENSETKAK